ncbi:hypothetical protein OG802_23470 [Streptomyces sp. NBC_00704]|jgi:hypothetical protein|uniref:hypothetical protein n=1 Tax=Streptomyces sp. NBC_00704 TaxID=2975809 RepID=UPI002E319858|nr:hypothetical protein [Streptomyces sp. NBC_00704]
MSVDPTDPGTFEEDDDFGEIDVEAPENDAAEQSTDVKPERDDPLEDVDPARADEADLVEQARVVPLEEEDYR